jgi:hypothetical protein
MPLLPDPCRPLAGASCLLLALLLSVPAAAEPAPAAYSATYVNAMLGLPMTVEFRRDGNKALVDESTQPTPENPGGWRQRNLYDLSLGANYTLSDGKGSACNVQRIEGDTGDPVEGSATLLKLVSQANPKRLGTEIVNGFPTQVLEVDDVAGLGHGKLWVDEKDGLLVKWLSLPASGPEKVLWELKNVTRTRPDPSSFALPPACASLAVPLSPEQEIANDTGGKVGDYLDAKLGPASSERCQVLFKVVQKGALQQVGSGFQVAVDTSIGPEGREYHTDMDQDGIARFFGGSIHELTKQLKSGSLRILNPPEKFLVSVNFPHGYDVDGQIFRKCFGPETTLLLLVDETHKPLHWLWVKPQH